MSEPYTIPPMPTCASTEPDWEDLYEHTKELIDWGTAGWAEVERLRAEAQALRAKLEVTEKELVYRKNNFEQSCLWPSTIMESDQLMPDGRPQKLAVVPNWCIHKVRTQAATELRSQRDAARADAERHKEKAEALAEALSKVVDCKSDINPNYAVLIAERALAQHREGR